MIKRPDRNSEEFSRDREFSVVLERIHSDFRIMAEDLATLKNRVNMLFDEFGRQKEDIALIKADIRFIKADMKVMRADIDVMKADIDVMKADIVVMKADIDVMKADIVVMKADIAEIKTTIKGHDKRMALLESAPAK